MAKEFIDRVVRLREAKPIHGYSDVHMRRLEEAGMAPKRMKLRPDSGKYGASGYMLSWLQAFNRWRAAGCPGSWAEWWAVETESDKVTARVAAKAAERDDIDADGNDAGGEDDDAEDEDEAA